LPKEAIEQMPNTLHLNHSKTPNFLVLSTVFWLLFDIHSIASAQILPDNTLPHNSVVTPNGDVMEIRGGTVAGRNQFHSFEEFSLPTGNTAFFNNPLAIENIISRVTGNSISNIDGLIRANGTANLFLINPSGIVFGKDASLNIGGSFIGTTANSIKFADGSEFSATNPQTSPLLTVSIPIGLQFGNNVGGITVRGEGNNTGFNLDDFSVIRDYRPFGLQVNSGQTLALVGGNVALEGGNITAESGRIELGSVDGEGLVKLTSTNPGWSLNYEDIQNLQDINLSSAASLEVSGNGGGNVRLQGKHISILDGSAILADTLGDGTGGTLGIKASEELVVAGTSDPSIPFISRLSTDAAPGSTGKGGNINIDTGHLVVADGAQILSSTFGTGNTGNLNVKASEIELIGGSPVVDSSGLFTLVMPGSSGKGGNVNIDTGSLLVTDGAQAANLTFSDGNAGNLTVKGKNVELIGTSPNGFPSSFLSNADVGSTGNGGDLTIEADRLRIADGAQIVVNTFGAGNTGKLTVRANDIELIGGSQDYGASGLFVNVEPEATGNGDNLTIETDRLKISDGARVEANTYSSGNTGKLTVRANDIELVGGSPDSVASGLFVNVEPEATGNGDSLKIETDRLRIADGAQIISNTFGDGDAGNLTVKARNLELVGTSPNDFPSQLSASVEEEAAGNGGNLTIETEKLQVRDGAQIAVATAGEGNAGGMQVRSKEIELIGGSEEILTSSGIFASAIIGTGNGGELDIVTDRLAIEDGATISTSNFASRDASIPPGQGKAGNIRIDTNSLQLDNTSSMIPSSITASTNSAGGGSVILNVPNSLIARNNSQISAETKGKGNGGDIQVTTDFFNLINGAQISTNSEGLGQAGKITVNARQINLDRGQITATSLQSGGGDIKLAIDNNLILGNNSLISTSVLDSTGGGGNIKIDNNLLVAFDNSDIRANAVLGAGGNIQITTKGLFQSANSDITASSQLGVDGIVSIVNPELDNDFGLMPLPENTIAPNQKVTTSCSIQPINNLVIAGKGGLPENPNQTVINQALWIDLRILQDDREPTFSNLNSQKFLFSKSTPETHQHPSTIVEAQGWIVSDRGNVELLPASPKLNFKNAWQPSDRCSNWK
jgi:filamentous hemagglutinin family protein